MPSDFTGDIFLAIVLFAVDAQLFALPSVLVISAQRVIFGQISAVFFPFVTG